MQPNPHTIAAIWGSGNSRTINPASPNACALRQYAAIVPAFEVEDYLAKVSRMNPFKHVDAALDTSCGASLALAGDGQVFWRDALVSSGRDSDRELPGWLETSLTRVGVSLEHVDSWTVGTGPGSFSGLRVGLALVAGMCLAGNVPHRGLPSSLALALAATDGLGEGSLIGVLHDARRGQLIFSGYRLSGGTLDVAGEPLVLTATELLPTVAPCARLVTVHGAAATALLPPTCWRPTARMQQTSPWP